MNVGAGTGAYEPGDRWVLAVEPSAGMRARRPPTAAPAICGRAEALPLDDDAVDAALACVTIHHWESLERGLAELRRVARDTVVVFTFDLDALPGWIQDYLRDALVLERTVFPSIEAVTALLGGATRVEHVLTPADCSDGFVEAFWNRPEALLDPGLRASQSVWRLLGPAGEERVVERLRADLRSGAWDEAHGHLRAAGTFDGALRLVVSEST